MRLTPADLEFRFTPHRLCLDFLATVGERAHRDIERLTSTDRYAEWCVKADVLDEPPLMSEDDLTAAKDFRSVLERLTEAYMAERRPDAADVSALNEFARRPVPRAIVRRDEWRVLRAADAPGPAVIAAVARDFLDLVRRGDASRVKRCVDPTCGMLFLDASRAGNRQWCAVEGRGCGNKAKKRAFRSRQALA
jgi:predicted RNA-binding Zn ribbon-like protein